MTRRWLPKSLTTQILLVAITGIILTQMLSVQIYRNERSDVVGQVNNRYTLLRVISVVRLLTDTPEDLHPELLRASRSENLMLRLQSLPLLPEHRNAFYEAKIRRELAYPETLQIQISVEQENGAPPPEMLRPVMQKMHNRGKLPPRDIRLYGTIELPNGKWLNFSSLSDAELPGWSASSILGLLMLASLIGAMVVWLLRRATRPLQQLAQQAEQFGRGQEIPPLPEQGPEEIGETLAAFNRMQQRLNRFVQDRTQMLGAISHDLRTPLTSLRLRCEFIADGEDKERMLETLAQMEEMLKATLSFARDDYSGEATREVDLQSLLQSLSDDYQDQGHKVELKAADKVIYSCRPALLRRAIQNLVDNALHYAGDAEMTLESEDEWLKIAILDNGPGIAEEWLEQVFKPFVRLDPARNMEAGNVGLGLSIARTLIHQHGGELTLSNRPQGGLCATIALPR